MFNDVILFTLMFLCQGTIKSWNYGILRPQIGMITKTLSETLN